MITVLLLSWKREANLGRMLTDIRRQSVPTEVFLWNNNAEDTTQYPVDLQINSSRNLMCWPRWLLSAYARGEYVCTLDDDLTLGDEHVLRDLAGFCTDHSCSAGLWGVIRVVGARYFRCRHISPSAGGQDQPVDLLKGRLMMVKTAELQAVPILPKAPVSIEEARLEDDILISSYIGAKVVPSLLCGRTVELPTHGRELFKQWGHSASRERACRSYLGWT